MAAPAGPMPAFDGAARTRSPTPSRSITLDRPEALNALTVPLKVELLAAFRADRAGTGASGRSC